MDQCGYVPLTLGTIYNTARAYYYFFLVVGVFFNLIDTCFTFVFRNLFIIVNVQSSAMLCNFYYINLQLGCEAGIEILWFYSILF